MRGMQLAVCGGQLAVRNGAVQCGIRSAEGEVWNAVGNWWFGVEQ